MKQSKFSKKRLAVYISAILTSGFSQQIFAEEATAEEQETEVIEVRGIRGSLVKSMNIKRDMSGVVDAISAEEMGKFPDTNLAESLQRITGVSVSRSNGEGSEITVRGFGPAFNLITLNGRQMPGTGFSRSYKLENLSSDGVSALEVFKTARAENPSGGLGATVNIVTTKPLQSPGLKYVVTGKALHDTSNVEGDDVTPELSALFSNTFMDDSLGFSLSVSHQQRDFQQQSANIQGWQYVANLPNLDDDKVVDNRVEGAVPGGYFPRDMNYGIANIEREKTNAQATFQYAPTDNLILTLDYTISEATTGKNSLGWGQWHIYGGNINAYELDENGTVTFADFSGADSSYTASRETTQVDEKSLGFNIDWQMTDDIHLSLDYHNSESKNNNGADTGMPGTGSLVFGSDKLINKHYDFRAGDIPQITTFWQNGTTTLSPEDIDSHFSQFLHNPGKSEVEQLQLDGVWENPNDSSLINIKFGAARTEQAMSGTNTWSGLIGGFGFSPDYTTIFPDSMFVQHSTDDLLDAFSSGDNPMAGGYYYSFDFDQAVGLSQAYLNRNLLGDDYFSTNPYRPGSTQSGSNIEEVTNSIYMSSLWEFEIADLPVQISAGFRYEQTDVTSNESQPLPVAVWWKGDDEWHTQYAPGDNTIFTEEGDYDVFLPMIDAKIELTDDIVARASWSKTISRAPLGNLAGGQKVGESTRAGNRVASEGNTNLLPYESTNIDLSFEYYYAEGSYASIGYFKKTVENFISTTTKTITIGDMREIYQGPRWQQAVADLGGTATVKQIFDQMQANGAVLNDAGYITPAADDPLIEWLVTFPFNNKDTRSTDGFEVAVQHLFGDSGFGIGVNATFVDGDVEFNVEDLAEANGDLNALVPQTPLTGLSDSANFQAFYEKDGLSVKATYAWRDSYLIGVGQSQGSADVPPQHAKSYGQWDLSINYDVNDNVTVFFEGVNLNNETEQHYGRYEEQFLRANQYGPRYALGFRYSFK